MTLPYPADQDRLSTALSGVLDAVRTAAMDLNVDLPPVQRVTTGSLAHDCEQVLVVGSGLTTGMPLAPDSSASGAGACGPMWTLVTSIDIVRCAPTMTESGVTDTDAIEASLPVVSADVAVLQGAINAINDMTVGDLTASLTFKAPSGNYRSTSVSIRMVLP